MSIRYHQSVYALSPHEAACLGWVNDDGTVAAVLTTLGPDGKRIIPTRDVIEGNYVYGFISTFEHPIDEPDELAGIPLDADGPPVGQLM